MSGKKQKRKAAKAKRRATRPLIAVRRAKVSARAAVAPAVPAPAPPKPAGESDTTAFIRRESMRYDGDTAIKLYLREIGQVKLLTPQEEIQLAARIKKGDKKARELMIKANLRLVVKIARDYDG
ncbi:MAG: sigma-70 factor domain-containing protein, partial [Verrucomicrobiota bacterium]